MPFGLSDKVIEFIKDTFNSNKNIESAILFGSRAKGSNREGSDIDIALKGKHLSLADVIKLKSIFEESDLPYTFDILIYQDIKKPALISHIDRVGIELYKKN